MARIKSRRCAIIEIGRWRYAANCGTRTSTAFRRLWHWIVIRKHTVTHIPDTALSLMRMALALLDKRGEEASLCAIYLRTAIDAKTDEMVGRQGNQRNDGHGQLRGH